jgi:sugar phosphate isomerase/epimerase
VALTPGTGQVDFATLMKKLRAGGLTHGPLLIECLAPGDPAATLAEAKKAKTFVERLVATL